MAIKPLLLILLLGTLGCVFSSTTVSPRLKLVGQNRCTWGPAYWCSHVAKAKECGAIEHCATVWGKLKFPEKAETCAICESFVIGAEKLNTNKIPMKDIGNYMDGMCTHFEGKEIKEKCQRDVVEYLPELFKLLNFGMDAKGVCHTLNFCLKSEFPSIKKSANEIPIANTHTRTVHITTTPPDTKICKDCKVFFTDVRNRVTSTPVINNVEQIFNREVCPYLGPFSKMCQQYVKLYVPLLMQELSMYIAPDFFCSVLTFCPTSREEAVSQMLKMFMKKDDQNICTECETFLESIKKKLQANETTEELLKILKQDLCNHLGQYKEMCDMVVDSYVSVILSDLVEKISTKVICSDIGFCPRILINAIADHFSTIKFSTVNPFQEATECEMCKVLLKELRTVVEDKKVQTQITDFISNEVCARLGDMKSACLQLVLEYKPLIIKSIESLLDPNAGCAAVGMCANDNLTTVKPSSLPMTRLLPALLVPFQRVGLVLPQKPTFEGDCALCKMVISELEGFLKNAAIQKEIESLLSKICELLPGSYAEKCSKFITTYTAGLIDILIQELKPDLICESLGVCTAKAILTSNFGNSKEIGCSYCNKILNEAFGILTANPYMNEKDFKASLFKICLQSEEFTFVCEMAVPKYGNAVYEALMKGETPHALCASYKICPAVVVEPNSETEHYFLIMCEILKATGINTECKDLAAISKQIDAEVKSTSILVDVPDVKASSVVTCDLCKVIVGEVEGKITAKTTEEEIKEFVDKLCGKISPNIETECNALMQYEDDLIKLLIKRYSADKICQELKLCSSSHTLYYKPKMFIV